MGSSLGSSQPKRGAAEVRHTKAVGAVKHTPWKVPLPGVHAHAARGGGWPFRFLSFLMLPLGGSRP